MTTDPTWVASEIQSTDVELIQTALPRNSILYDTIKSTIDANRFFQDTGGDLIGIVHPEDFRRLRAEINFNQQQINPFSDYSVHVQDVRIFSSTIAQKGIFKLYVKFSGNFSIPRFVRSKTVTSSESALVSDLLDWIEEGRKKGKSIDWLIKRARDRFSIK